MNYRDIAMTLYDAGFAPLPLKEGEKRPSVSGWSTVEIEKAQVQQWADNGHGTGGVGIRCSQDCAGLDIDIYDKKISNIFYNKLKLLLDDDAPLVRVGQEPKFLLPFSLTGDVSSVLRSGKYQDKDGKEIGQIEVFPSNKHQFVAYGVHPATGKEYRWINGTLSDSDLFSLPSIDELDILALIDEFEEMAKEKGWVQISNRTLQQKTARIKDDPFAGLQEPSATMTELREYVMSLPDVYNVDREQWIKVGMAIHFESSGSDEGLKLFHSWSMLSESYKDEKDVRYVWESFKVSKEDTNLVTMGSIKKILQDEGVTVKRVRRTKKEIGEELERSEGVLKYMQKRFVYMRDGNNMIDLERQTQNAVMALAEFKQAFRKEGTVIMPGSDRPKLAINAFFDNSDYRKVIGEKYHPDKPVLYSDNNEDWFNPAHFPRFKDYQEDDVAVEPFVDHIRYLMPGDQYERFMDWLTWTVIKPGIRIKFTPLLISRHHRTGRGWVAELIGKLIGEWNCSSVTIQELAGSGMGTEFHNYMHKNAFCALHEVYVSGSKVYEVDDAIRSKLTESSYYMNLKYGKAGVHKVFTNFLMMSNHRDALSLQDGDERIEVFEHFSKPREEEGYYVDIYDMLHDKSKVGAFYHYLERRFRIRKKLFNPMAPAMMTPAKRRMIGVTTSDVEHTFEESILACGSEVVSVRMIKSYMVKTMVDQGLSAKAAEEFVGENEKQILALTKKNFAQLNGGKRIFLDGISVTAYCTTMEDKWTTASTSEIREEYAKNLLGFDVL